MSIAKSDPPWDFFHDASIASLQSFELSRLNHAANLRREIAALLDQWINDNSQALLARWVREHRALPRPLQPDAIANFIAHPATNPFAAASDAAPHPLQPSAQPQIEQKQGPPFEQQQLKQKQRQQFDRHQQPHSGATFEANRIAAKPVAKPAPRQATRKLPPHP